MNLLERLIPAVLLLLVSQLLAFPAESGDQDAAIQGRLEVGVDQLQRQYARPHLRFTWPVLGVRAYAEMFYEQRLNGRLRGDIDIWINGGLTMPLGSRFSAEVGLRHLSRHTSSRENPRVYNLNEILARLWFEGGGVRLGAGAGSYVKRSEGHSCFLRGNIGLPRILGSEFSLRAELTLLDHKQALYDIGLEVALAPSVDLFVRTAKTYAYPAATYVGLGLNSDSLQGRTVEHLDFRIDVLPADDGHRLINTQVLGLEFLHSPERRLCFQAEVVMPVLKSVILGEFRPEWIHYPLQLQYEKKVQDKICLFGYCLYDVSLPVDRSETFRGDLGLGLGLRNQPNFVPLLSPVRYEVSCGLNFAHSYDAGIALGLNTMSEGVNFGSNLVLRFNPDEWSLRLVAFVEWGKEARARPYIGFEDIHRSGAQERSGTRFLIGLEFYRWFRRTS